MNQEVAASMGQLNLIFKVADFLIGKKNVKIIFEFGSRYGEDTIQFANRYPSSTTYSFECNPKTVPDLRNNIKRYDNIVFNEYAVSNENKKVDFYQINQEKTKTTWIDGNQGASSLFQASGKYPLEELHQRLIRVEAITLDFFLTFNNIKEIDILWMDIQGAELHALMGLKDKIKNLKIVHLEVEFIQIYKQQPLFTTINKFMQKHNFSLLGFTTLSDYSGDAIYVNEKYFDKQQIENASLLMPQIKKSLIYCLKKMLFHLKYMGFQLKVLFFKIFFNSKTT